MFPSLVLTHVEDVRFLNSFDPSIFANFVLASFFRKMTATEQKLPSVSPAEEVIVEDQRKPLLRAFSWQHLYFVTY
jgi:hypothetical protein